MRTRLLAVVAMCIAIGTSTGSAATMVGRTTAARYGLKMAWFAQIGAAQSTGPISYVAIGSDMLVVQTTRNLVSGVDPLSGRIYWSAQAGPPNHASTQPAVNAKYIVVVNGSMLYVLDRANGGVVWQKLLTGSPGAGPGITETHVFVPMLNGQVEGYDLEKGSKQTPWVYKSAGRVLTSPMVTPQTLSWTTEKGYLYVADSASLGIRYRLETRDVIHASPTYWTPHLYAGSTDGSVYAVNEGSGRIVWKFSVGDAIFDSPVAIEDKVFVVSQFDGMYCLDAKHAAQLWFAPQIKQFLATSPTRVYACDKIGRLAILDAKSGARLATMPLEAGGLRLTNVQSDRIYLTNDGGVVQCLHEAALPKPVVYTPPTPEVPQVKSTPQPRGGKKEGPASEGDEVKFDEGEMTDQPPADPDDAPPSDDAPATEDKPAEPAANDDPFK